MLDYDAGEGSSTLELKLFGHRGNTFGHVHNCREDLLWAGPAAWRVKDAFLCDEYCLKPLGILNSPIIYQE
jgi:hypothetical protein